MARTVTSIGVSAGVLHEIGYYLTQGGLVHLKNLGPHPVWLRNDSASISSTGSFGSVLSGHESESAWLLSPGDSVKVRVPAYPQLSGFVPTITSVDSGSTVSAIVEGE